MKCDTYDHNHKIHVALMFTFNHMPFHHFVQEVNEIWYPKYTIIKLLIYQISRQAIHLIEIILQSLYNIIMVHHSQF